MDEEAAKEFFKAMLKEQDESEAEPLIKTFRSKTNLQSEKLQPLWE